MLRMQRPADRRAIYLEVQAVDPALFAIFREVKGRFAAAGLLPGVGRLPVAVGVGPKVEVEAVQGLRGVVLVGDGDVAVEEVLFVVQPDVDLVVQLLLEVVFLPDG